VHPNDNIIVALENLSAGEVVSYEGVTIEMKDEISLKHKFAEKDLEKGQNIIMYGVIVGKAKDFIKQGSLISQANVAHDTADYQLGERNLSWTKPDVSRFSERTFMGYHREDGQVGTRNHWLVIPLVFCENRNINVLREAMSKELGYISHKDYSVDVRQLVKLYQNGASESEILSADVLQNAQKIKENRVFPNIDGIKFLTHDGGCGGIRQDSEALCNLLAGYITHPNVAGATVLSLGCQNAQIPILEEAIKRRNPNIQKPVYFLEQQKSSSERAFIAEAVQKTFVGMAKANELQRAPAPISKLTLGLECGGSDGFSGISANPVLGYASDMIVTMGGKTILSEFPELNGVEQELVNRCVSDEAAQKFSHLMKSYAQRAEAAGSGFDMNPSPGNIRDGLITDAMKSAGAAKKGGTSPVIDVLDYTEPAVKPGLNLLCTPGNDVESTTGLAGSWANLIVFTTGLGTPTGNPVAPVLKISSNTILADRMADIIDLDTGPVIAGTSTIEEKGEELLDLIIRVASGEMMAKAEELGQDDFIPWKRGISL
ncbi:MAG: altronate dehydratase, partial [Bacteroidetes bacterium]|nr:altronate dehydratase [Bacteroidota bacterium]